MLPGVELARRRRVHYHGDAASSSAAAGGAGGEHHHYYAHAHRNAGPAAAAVAGPAMAARIRLEEKLRGAALPSSATSPSRWSRRLMGEAGGRRGRRERQQEEQAAAGQEGLFLATPALITASAAAAAPPAGSSTGRRAELTRTLSMVDVCAVCLEEVRERRERVTRLPCSHKYHSECVLPWLAIQPDCPCCRALVPSADTLAS